jgi:hypothetical protein
MEREIEMKAGTLASYAFLVFLHQVNAWAAEPPNPKQYIHQRGWEPYDAAHTARTPSTEIVPVLYYENEDSVPSCGLLSSVPGAKEPRFTELMHAPKGEEFPQCVDVVSFVPFMLNSKDYLSVEYLVRDTRDDLYRKFIYLYRDPKQGYTLDPAGPKPSTIKAKNIAAMTPTLSTVVDGLKPARAAYLKQAYPQWQFRERDFISDKGSSFAVFDDSQGKTCHVVTEAGDTPIVASEADYSPGSRCTGILASSRLENPGMTYYIGLLKLSTGAQLAALTSVTSNGEVRVEKELAERVNRAGATKDIKSVKAAIAEATR